MQPAATIAGALLAANPNALRDPDAVAKVFIATYRQLEKPPTNWPASRRRHITDCP